MFDRNAILTALRATALPLLLAAAAVIAVFSLEQARAVPADLPEPGPSTLRDFWFSGAELNRYELTQSRYGDTHPGHAELIFVTEPFLQDEQVKRDYGNAPAIDVLKLNALRTFNTGLYSYRTMRSVFTPFEGQGARETSKVTLSVQDWCGQVFMQVNRRNSRLAFDLRSYFQSEGDRDYDVAAEDVVLEEGLWTQLRLDPTALPTGEFEAVPSLLSSRLAHRPAKPYTAMASLRERSGLAEYTLEYPELGRRLVIRFDPEFPFVIRGWTERNGTNQPETVAQLKERQMNVPYWRFNAPGDRERREALGLSPVPR